MAEMRLAGICKDCIKRLGVDERMTIPLQVIRVDELPQYDPKAVSNVHFPSHLGRAKITYKIAKTVKETVDDHPSGQ